MFSCDRYVDDFELPVRLCHFAAFGFGDGTSHEACSDIDIPFLDNGADLQRVLHRFVARRLQRTVAVVRPEGMDSD